MFPEDVSGSLTSLAQYFKIPVDENETHTSKYDTELTFKVFMALRKLLMSPALPPAAPLEEWGDS
jgi:DNA polymerase III epsilon subunit-like protein